MVLPSDPMVVLLKARAFEWCCADESHARLFVGDVLVDFIGSGIENGAAPIYEGEPFSEPHTFIGFRVVRRVRG